MSIFIFLFLVLFVVFGVNVVLYLGGEEWGEEVVRVCAGSSENKGGSVHLNAGVTVSTMPEKLLSRPSTADLLAPNYAPVTPLPSASVVSYFVVAGYILSNLLSWRVVYNEGHGSISRASWAPSYYEIRLDQWSGLSLYYEVGVGRTTWLRHSNPSVSLIVLAPISLLV